MLHAHKIHRKYPLGFPDDPWILKMTWSCLIRVISIALRDQ